MPGIFTISHSNQRIEAHQVTLLGDVRAAPYSRRHPQFKHDALAAGLAAQGIRYRWLGEPFGGMRESRADRSHEHRVTAAGFVKCIRPAGV